ncbi:glycosyltransferase family 2 protein [Salmonella enterica]|nr:glycosyltransferase family 2 protein [Salmonella enterica]
MASGTRTAVLISTYNWPEALTLCLRSLFRQTLLPDEIVIADDGSGESTRAAVARLTEESPRPLKHVWQADKGFRLSEIRNKAIAASEADYIVQVDGDCVLERHFIEDHMSAAEPGRFVCGGRVRLSEEESLPVLAGEVEDISLSVRNPYRANSLRVGLLRRLLADRYGDGAGHVHGCNMAFWRDDLISVNGYDEGFNGWGHEDRELAVRLINAGVRRKSLKFGGVCYHLHHEPASKANTDVNMRLLNRAIGQKSARCANGLDKHLPHDNA